MVAEPIFQATSEVKIILCQDSVFVQRSSTFCLRLGVESRDDVDRKAPVACSHCLPWMLPDFDFGPNMTTDPLVAAKFLYGSNK